MSKKTPGVMPGISFSEPVPEAQPQQPPAPAPAETPVEVAARKLREVGGLQKQVDDLEAREHALSSGLTEKKEARAEANAASVAGDSTITSDMIDKMEDAIKSTERELDGVLHLIHDEKKGIAKRLDLAKEQAKVAQQAAQTWVRSQQIDALIASTRMIREELIQTITLACELDYQFCANLDALDQLGAQRERSDLQSSPLDSDAGLCWQLQNVLGFATKSGFGWDHVYRVSALKRPNSNPSGGQ